MELTNDELIKTILSNLKKLDYIKPEEIPNIDLYMDQVTTFMDEHLESTKRFDDDKLLTKTMINNYTKNNLLPPSNRKKYSKEHMLLLIFIYYFKNILSINDIQNIFNPLTEKFYSKNSDIDLEDIYKGVFSLEKEQMDILMKDVLKKYRKSKDTFNGAKSEDREFLNIFSFICMLSFDVYIKKMIIENLIDKFMEKTEAGTNEKGEKRASENKKNPVNGSMK